MSEAITTGEGAAAYDSAKSSPTRSNFLAFPTNSRRELTPLTRRQIVQKSRALEANLPFLTRVKMKYARMAVGTGIHFRFITEDVDFNDAAQRDVETWWNNKDLYSIDGSVDGWEAKRLAAETILIDGEYPATMVTGLNDWPMLQPLDVFEIETPPENNLRRQWDDGVRINEFERPMEYAVRSLPRLIGDLTRDFRYVPRESMIHLFKRRRARGHRGMPWGYSGINQGIDALDLNALVTGTAKLHSALAVAVKGTAKKGKRGALNKITTGGGGGEAADTQALEKIFGGGMINYLGENGELQLLSSQHPGSNVLEFIKLLCHQMCGGFDMPFSIMWDMGQGGGTGVRYDAEDAQSAFDQLGDLITWHFVRREIIWKVSKAIKAGRIAKPKDAYWFEKILFRGPRKLTVDVGRMATAFKTLTRNAGMSIPRFLEEQGLDAYAEMRDQIRFLKFIREESEKEGVDVNWLYEPTPGVVNQLTVQQQNEE
jgi:capsid protein